MAKKKRSTKKACRRVTFNKGKRNAKTVTLCDRGPGKSAKRKAGRAGAKASCRAGGAGWAKQVKKNFKAGKSGATALRPARFVAC